MADPTFTVEHWGRGWAVFRDGARVTGIIAHWHHAMFRRDELARAARTVTRACLCCGTSFASEGPHNRLCDPCRTADFGLAV